MTSNNHHTPPTEASADIVMGTAGNPLPPDRGILLTVFLGVAALIALAAIGASIFYWKQMVSSLPEWVPYSVVAIAAGRLAAVVAIWRWSRLGVIAYVIFGFLASYVSLAFGVGLPWFGGGAAIVLCLLISRKWARMPWGLFPRSVLRADGLQP